jgi:hypothetical protein
MNKNKKNNQKHIQIPILNSIIKIRINILMKILMIKINQIILKNKKLFINNNKKINNLMKI